MCEPLKGKVIECGEIMEFNKGMTIFASGDISSAAKGLQHDIMYGREFVMFPRTRRKALELVMKWFPDAIDKRYKGEG